MSRLSIDNVGFCTFQASRIQVRFALEDAELKRAPQKAAVMRCRLRLGSHVTSRHQITRLCCKVWSRRLRLPFERAFPRPLLFAFCHLQMRHGLPAFAALGGGQCDHQWASRARASANGKLDSASLAAKDVKCQVQVWGLSRNINLALPTSCSSLCPRQIGAQTMPNCCVPAQHLPLLLML